MSNSSNIIQNKYTEILNDRSTLTLKEILLLDNVAYFRTMQNTNMYITKNVNAYFKDIGDYCEIDIDIIEEMKQAEYKAGYTASGEEGVLPIGWTEEEMNEAYARICSSESIMNLKIINTISDSGLTATCYQDENNNVYVIFRGTDGPIAWEDNAIAMGEVSSELQERARRFYVESLTKIENPAKIIVSGHSKGGNMAKYVSLLHDEVDCCVALDGQGFSREFFEDEYIASQIEKNKDKIIEINAEYDFVHCLGEQLEFEEIGNRYFIKTEFYSEFSKNHFPDIFFDEEDKIRDFTYERSELSNTITVLLHKLITEVSEENKEVMLGDIGELLLKSMVSGDTDSTLYKGILEKFFYKVYYEKIYFK